MEKIIYRAILALTSGIAVIAIIATPLNNRDFAVAFMAAAIALVPLALHFQTREFIRNLKISERRVTRSIIKEVADSKAKLIQIGPHAPELSNNSAEIRGKNRQGNNGNWPASPQIDNSVLDSLAQHSDVAHLARMIPIANTRGVNALTASALANHLETTPNTTPGYIGTEAFARFLEDLGSSQALSWANVAAGRFVELGLHEVIFIEANRDTLAELKNKARGRSTPGSEIWIIGSREMRDEITSVLRGIDPSLVFRASTNDNNSITILTKVSL